MVLKGDSCLLNGGKPLFLPDWTSELGVTECMILRVSRLGKEIDERFANRYYDAVAPGADFVALDILREAQANGQPWTTALAFDYSLAIGKWINVQRDNVQGTKDKGQRTKEEFVMTPEEAVAAASKVMTIRQGDLIYIHKKHTPRVVHKEDIIRTEANGEEKLYCKIK